ncbi:winged helix-turn-helix domain-containing protein [Bradyrhizobium rifense]
MPPDQRRSIEAIKIRFEPFELNVLERSLKKAGETIPLGGRAFDLLLALIERSGETVGKDELIAHVWPDVTVEEGSLRVHMSVLRKALGDGQLGRRRYIANVKGRGYCFVAPVTRQTRDNDPRNLLAQPSRIPVQPGCTADGDEAILSLKAMLQTERLTRALGIGRSAIDPKLEKMNSAVIGVVRMFADLIVSLLDTAEQVAQAEETVIATRDEPVAEGISPQSRRLAQHAATTSADCARWQTKPALSKEQDHVDDSGPCRRYSAANRRAAVRPSGEQPGRASSYSGA